MSTLGDLFAAVLAEPDSDVPRLVYADALQAAGDPRGEFIALQCELARLGCDRTRCANWVEETPGAIIEHTRRDWIGDGFATGSLAHVATLRDRATALLSEHREAWAPGLIDGCRFRRGFLDHVLFPIWGFDFDVFAVAPLTRSIEIGQYGTEPYAETRLAQLEQLRVTISSSLEREAFRDVMPRLANLRELSLCDQVETDSLRLFELPFLRQLRGLELYGYNFEDPRSLDDVLEAAQLRDLRLGRNRSPHHLLDVLARCPYAEALEILDVFVDGVDENLVAGLRSPRLRKLHALRVLHRQSEWRESTLRDLGTSMVELQILDLGGNAIGPQLAEPLDGFPKLVQLGLPQCDLDDERMEQLAASPLIRRIRMLDLRSNEAITDDGAQALAEARHLALERIDLRNTRVGKAGAAILRRADPELHVQIDEAS